MYLRFASKPTFGGISGKMGEGWTAEKQPLWDLLWGREEGGKWSLVSTWSKNGTPWGSWKRAAKKKAVAGSAFSLSWTHCIGGTAGTCRWKGTSGNPSPRLPWSNAQVQWNRGLHDWWVIRGHISPRTEWLSSSHLGKGTDNLRTQKSCGPAPSSCSGYRVRKLRAISRSSESWVQDNMEQVPASRRHMGAYSLRNSDSSLIAKSTQSSVSREFRLTGTVHSPQGHLPQLSCWDSSAWV